MGKKKNKKMRSHVQIGEAAALEVPLASPVKAKTPASALVVPAPPLSRLYAYAIDWAVGGVVSGFPAVLLYAAVTRRNDMFSNLYIFEALGYPWAVGMVAGTLCILAAILYFVVVPLRVWPGQTLGKRIAHIKVLREDGTSAGPLCLVIRQVLVGFLLEGSGFVVARYIREMAVLATRVDVNYYWEIAGMVITLISGILALALPSRRALHDYLARTRVVPAEGHPLYRG